MSETTAETMREISRACIIAGESAQLGGETQGKTRRRTAS